MLKLLGVISLLNVIQSQYLAARNFRFSNKRSLGTDSGNHIRVWFEVDQYRQYPSVVFALNHTLISCHDNATGQVIDQKNFATFVNSTRFEQLIAGKAYAVKVAFFSAKGHQLGHGEASYYLESTIVMDSGINIDQDSDNNSQINVRIKPFSYSIYGDLELVCKLHFAGLRRNFSITRDTSAFTRYPAQLSTENIILSTITRGSKWTKIQLEEAYSLAALSVNMTVESIHGKNLAAKNLSVTVAPSSDNTAEPSRTWILSFDREYDIGKIKIRTNTSICDNRPCNGAINNLLISGKDSSLKNVSAQPNGVHQLDGYTSISILKFLQRFVVQKILLVSTDPDLNITVEEVYQKDDVNIASGKTATQSSTANTDTTAEKAVNGQIDPSDFTRTSTKGGWWLVDLGEIFDIETIVLYKGQGECRRTTCDDELKEVTIFTGYSAFIDINMNPPNFRDSDKWVNRSYQHEPYGNIAAVTFSLEVIAKYVAVVAGESTFLSLSEVEIFRKDSRRKAFKLAYSGTSSVNNMCSPTNGFSRSFYRDILLFDQVNTVLYERSFYAQTIALCGVLRRPINITGVSVYKAAEPLINGKAQIESITLAAGEVLTCNISALPGRYLINNAAKTVGIRPQSPQTDIKEHIYFAQDGEVRVPYIEVKAKTYIYGVRFASRSILFTLSVRNVNDFEVLKTSDSALGVFKVKNITFGMEYTMSILAELLHTYNITALIAKNPGPSVSVKLAPLPVSDVHINVNNNDKLTTMLVLYPQRSRYDYVYIRCNGTDSVIQKFNMSTLNYTWTTLSPESEYTFEAWTYSSATNKNSTHQTSVWRAGRSTPTTSTTTRSPRAKTLFVSPAVKAQYLVKDNEGIPYLLVEAENGSTGNLDVSLNLEAKNLVTGTAILSTVKAGEPFKIKQVVFGFPYSLSITASAIVNGKRVDALPGPSITVYLAPLPPEELLFEIDEDIIVMKWKIHSQNHYQSVFTNCSVDSSTIFKIDAQADSFIWKNLQADTRYTFDVWTYSDTVDINSTRLRVYRSFQISKNTTSTYAALTYTAIGFLVLLAVVGVIIASLHPKAIKILTDIWNKKLVACRGKDSQLAAQTMINDSTIPEPTRSEPDNPEFSNRADKPQELVIKDALEKPDLTEK